LGGPRLRALSNSDLEGRDRLPAGHPASRLSPCPRGEHSTSTPTVERDLRERRVAQRFPGGLLTRKRTEVQLLPRPPHCVDQGFCRRLPTDPPESVARGTQTVGERLTAHPRCSLLRATPSRSPCPRSTRSACRALVETTESDTSGAQALATIDNCSTARRTVRAAQTVTNFCHAHQGASSGSQLR
jgi:hypothetical protein